MNHVQSMSEKKNKPPKKGFTLRLPKSLLDRIEEEARVKFTSKNAIITFLIYKHYKNEK